MRTLRPEQAAAAHTLDQHLSVTAGPGAGKTFVLVERYLEILRAKKISVDNIVAITFTNRAANEMRQRVRQRIDGLLREVSGDERHAWLRHKRALEGAVITTIHGFCSRLLHEFPVEANIDPQFVLLDEHQAAMLLESVVETTLADAIHQSNEKIIQLAQGTGRAALANALVELHRKYRGEGLSLASIEKLTAANHASAKNYAAALSQLDSEMAELFSAPRLTKAAEDKRARAAQAWPALRAILAKPPTEKTIATYCQSIEDFWDTRPQKNSHPVIERLDESLWRGDGKSSDHLGGRLPTTGFDLLAKEYSLALLKLLREIDKRLDAEKQRLSVLDFDDLQLRALRLLEHPEVLARISERYRFFLVDEFQDTNSLQRDLMTRLALVRSTNLFIVGDRKQSVYGFRGADVDVFSEMTAAIEAAGGSRQPLHLNFRSQQPLIEAFNFLFSRIFQARAEIPREALSQVGFVNHEPSHPERGTEHEPPLVEVMISAVAENSASRDSEDEFEAGDALSAHERDADQVAARIKSLVTGERNGEPGFEYKDVAILFRAFTGVWTYESALRRAGIPYLTVQGKGFYQREEITDLIQLLRFLDNTTDELALAAVLRSPLCGISDNALLALRCAPRVTEEQIPARLRRRNLLRALQTHRDIRFIEEAEHTALDRGLALLESLIQKRNRYGIAELLRFAVAASELKSVIAANFDGSQRITNVEKLFRLAEQFEKTGYLIRDFVHYVEEFEAIGGREGEGQMDESANVVRLMTIHQAKGLEFPVVIVPDLHREPTRRDSSFILDRHKGLTVKIPDGRGRSARGALFSDLRQRARWREEFEGMRLLYVAATRAKDRLILSGAVKQIKDLKYKTDNWLAQIWQATGLRENIKTGNHAIATNVVLKVVLNADGFLPLEDRRQPTNNRHPLEALETRPLAELFPLLGEVSAGTGHLLRRFSVTQLINFQRCARQYYFDRLLKAPIAEERAVWNDAEAAEPPANLTATLKGAVIHRFCETFIAGDDPETRLRESFENVRSKRQAELAGRAFEIDPDQAVRDLLPLAQNYLASEVFQRVTAAHRNDGESDNPQFAIRNPQSSPGLWSELRFRLRRPLGILTGTIDKLLITPALNGKELDVEIIDFKTNRLRPRSKSAKRPETAAVAMMSSSERATAELSREVRSRPAQGLLNFETVSRKISEDVTSAEVLPDNSIEEQIQTLTHDYRLQMQSYALALRELLPAEVSINSLRATLHFIDAEVEVNLPVALLVQETCAGAIDEAMLAIATLDSTLDENLYPPLPATHCSICNFLELCPAGREWLYKRNPNSIDEEVGKQIVG
jgi:ATP-dependent helicase/nuclease subunit A